ncbi:MAG: hypothetical protein GY711_03735 [bacterium]|nr:hypothetical protein [bacterium]
MPNIDEVLAEEKGLIAERREALATCTCAGLEEGHFAIALSGGGIRSATLSLGFVEVLNHWRVLEQADYLSSVSGGGYFASYVHAKLRATDGKCERFDNLMQGASHMRAHRRYLAPGNGWRRAVKRLRLFTAFLVSLAMNWVWIAAVLAVVVFGARSVRLTFDGLLEGFGPLHSLRDKLLIGTAVASGVVLAYHLLAHPLRKRVPWSSDWLNLVESVLVGVWLALVTASLIAPVEDASHGHLAVAVAALLVIGFFVNPNVLGMHRFYRDRLADAYLGAASPSERGVRMAELVESVRRGAPYPLINTCLNLRENSAARAQTSDYYLFSPLFCGSRQSAYVRTDERLYAHLPLSAAMASSGAAVHTGMGVRTTGPQAFLMTLLNLRLGQWVYNPACLRPTVPGNWWPRYHLSELFASAGTSSERVNISDGGHIENLAVFELLQRRCKLILALDAGADPNYQFSDLRNLVQRAREQLGLKIVFRQDPESAIRPSPSLGYSRVPFVIADVMPLEQSPLVGYTGILVYVKSSIVPHDVFTPVGGAPGSYQYKTTHPKFPHEPTTDQFFAEDQWDAYRELGRHLAGMVLGVDASNLAGPRRLEPVESLGATLDRLHNIDDAEAYIRRDDPARFRPAAALGDRE